ncbi:jg20808 [Pararge aegeria aegeria]|uniref:Jg20808 protein n=1 Tax=Pararge aegeria aegeria TaxID=348720 RepID=A0A8S4R8D0_9NEOP|nr:jg20808 [Pararge aegeria aegeria]
MFFHKQTVPKDRITDPAEQLRYLNTTRSNIRLEILVHEGTFGRVYKGVFKRGDTYEEVLVKTVSEAASAMQAALLVAEGLRLCGLIHANVLAPIAACAEEARKPLLVYCCVSHSSNLKRFLTSCRLGHQAAPATRELVDLGAQVACGLAYLHVQRLVHADIAARNCIVDEKLRLKVADNGLSRDLFPDDYHCLGDNENRPVKWMAPESLLQNQYTTASDVWSLGITLWELATLGASPLAELDAADVGAFLNGGYRPSQPHNCPDEL